MRRLANLLARLAVACLILVAIAAVVLLLNRQTRISFVGNQLGIGARTWDAVDEAFRERFPLGTARDIAIERLLEIDPKVARQLNSEAELNCPDSCCETVLLFEERLERGLGYRFCYDDQLKLLQVAIAS